MGDWWIWKVYYNTDGEVTGFGVDNFENTVYQLLNVFEVDAYTEVTPCQGCDPITVGPCDRQNVNMDEVNTLRAKESTIGDKYALLMDAEVWFGKVNILRVRQEALTEVSGGFPLGNGIVPAHNWYTSWDDFGNTTYGCPFVVGETYYNRQYILLEAIIPQHYEYNFVTDVPSYIEDYDLSDPATCPEVQGVGVYDVYYIEWTLEGTSDIALKEWYSYQAQTTVRYIDYATYYGHEDRALVAYEVADFGKADLTVSPNPPSQGDTLTVSINVTNTTGEARSFNLLLLIMDDDATANGNAYLNSKTVFPDMANPFPAIQQTSVLAPSASETITWTDIWTVQDSGPYTIWVSGESYSW